jgi:predicted dehydrogenase
MHAREKQGMSKTSIGIVGAGAIGHMHADKILQSDFATLSGIADPTEAGRGFAEKNGIAWFAGHREMLERGKSEAAIIATPNATHREVALDFIAAGVPIVVEKPIASTVEDGEAIASASEKSGVPVLVGHHRRHNPIIHRARAVIAEGALGRITAAAILASFFKPPEYFELAWRKQPGGGPVLINLIHEIDLVRHLCGEIASVQAITSNAIRGFEVEDTAAVVLRLVNGALVTVTLSDTAVTPWSWDLISGEIPSYPAQSHQVTSHFLCGTEGSLSLPGLEFWSYKGEKSWYAPLSRDQVAFERGDPYVGQLRNLCKVARGEEQPLVSAADGTQTLRATLAVHEAARTGRTVTVKLG